MEIESVTIKGFKCFKSARTLSFTGGLNCLQGSNGAGKTSSIEAICCLFGMTGRKFLRYSYVLAVVAAG
jgi:DNA repair exonuclease SbcCD ATPase subunit